MAACTPATTPGRAMPSAYAIRTVSTPFSRSGSAFRATSTSTATSEAPTSNTTVQVPGTSGPSTARIGQVAAVDR